MYAWLVIYKTFYRKASINFPLNIPNWDSNKQIIPFSIVCENANIWIVPQKSGWRKTCKRRLDSGRCSDDKTKSATYKQNEKVDYDNKGMISIKNLYVLFWLYIFNITDSLLFFLKRSIW